MSDVLTAKQRKFCMSQIKARNTKPELLLRKSLWNLGYRYRVRNKLAGKPDIVFPSYKVVIFIDGCFWHRCPKHYQAPKTRADFWEEKITNNVKRDKINNERLVSEGWLVIRIWEHEIKQSLERCVSNVLATLEKRRETFSI